MLCWRKELAFALSLIINNNNNNNDDDDDDDNDDDEDEAKYIFFKPDKGIHV